MDKKIDITLSRSYTINTGNYSSVKPEATITIKDIERIDFEREYNTLTNTLDSIIALEILKISEEMNEIKSKGINKYIGIINESIDIIKKEPIDSNLKNLINRFQNKICYIEVKDQAILHNLNTKKDYLKALKEI